MLESSQDGRVSVYRLIDLLMRDIFFFRHYQPNLHFVCLIG